MIWFPNCKINLGLNVIEKREDGFHNIETVFYPVQWKEPLEIIENKKPAERKVFLSCSGIRIGNDPEKNLAVKAYHLLDQEFNLPPVKIHLHKLLPMGAGLGGGSADAAFALKGLSALFKLNLNEEQLISFAKQLGSDCAFFIRNKPAFASGKGDDFENIHIDLKGYKLMIVWPDVHSNTSEAYSGIVPKKPAASCKEIVLKNISQWKNELTNDFEAAIFKKYPAIERLKQKLYDAGAVYASMSGSGSSVFGIFPSACPELKLPSAYKIYCEE